MSFSGDVQDGVRGLAESSRHASRRYSRLLHRAGIFNASNTTDGIGTWGLQMDEHRGYGVRTSGRQIWEGECENELVQ
jgi:hypothetical protein